MSSLWPPVECWAKSPVDAVRLPNSLAARVPDASSAAGPLPLPLRSPRSRARRLGFPRHRGGEDRTRPPYPRARPAAAGTGSPVAGHAPPLARVERRLVVVEPPLPLPRVLPSRRRHRRVGSPRPRPADPAAAQVIEAPALWESSAYWGWFMTSLLEFGLINPSRPHGSVLY